MGLFGRKKEEHYEVMLFFNQRVVYEDDVLPILFNQLKAHGISLLQEPDFDWHGCVFKLNGNLSGTVSSPSQSSHNASIIDFCRDVTSSVSEEELALAVIDFLGSLAQNIDFSYTAKKEGKRKYAYDKWERIYPDRRTYM